MRRLLVSLVVLTTLGGAACAPGASGRSHAGVEAAGPRADVEALDAAIASRDRTALDRLLAENLVWVRGSGEAGGKAEFIAALTRPTLRIEPFRPAAPRLYANETLELWTGVNTLRGEDDGEPFTDHHHFADLWEKREGRWVLVYIQVTRITAQPR